MGQITIDNLTKQFGDTIAVEDFTLEIDDGEFLVLVGPSGCGKSTTLRCLAGLEHPTSGDIYIHGEHMNYRVPQKRDIAMVFQDYALFPHMTVRQNIRFGLEQQDGHTRDEMEQAVVETAELLDIEELLDRKPGDISGGQQQRVALGRSIIRDPEVFLMDEPLSNLDAKLRAEMRTELQQLQDDLGVTTIYVTHNQTEAMTMGDRIAVMDSGRLQQVGEPLELYHTPANRFVAGFIGEPMMNFVHGTREDSCFSSEYFDYTLPDDILDALGDSDDLTLGIRPEDIDIHHIEGDDPPTTDEHEFSMVVSVVEPHGDQNVVHLAHTEAMEDHDVLQAITAGLDMAEVGEQVVVSFPPRRIHLFDEASGEALYNRKLEPEPEVPVC